MRLHCSSLLLGASLAAAPLAAQAATVVLVRHAEKAAESGDPDLSPAGSVRANALKEALASFPLQAIFVSNYRRTLQTAAPIAAALQLTPVAVPVAGNAAGQAAATAAALRALPAGSAALVVGHSNTVGRIIAALGGPLTPDLCDPEYATIFLLELPAGGPPRLLRASYGVADAVGATSCHP